MPASDGATASAAQDPAWEAPRPSEEGAKGNCDTLRHDYSQVVVPFGHPGR